MARGLRATFFTVMIGTLLAGCGGGGTDVPGQNGLPAETTALPDPCTLVTTQEATAALGEETKSCELRIRLTDFAMARFLSTGHNPASVTVVVAVGGRAEYDSLKKDAARTAEFLEVAGIGEAAFFTRPRGNAVVTFVKGSFVVEVSVGIVTGPPAQAAAVTLAQRAAARTAG